MTQPKANASQAAKGAAKPAAAGKKAKAAPKASSAKATAPKGGVSPLMQPLEEVLHIHLEHVAGQLKERGFDVSIVGSTA